MKDFNIILSSSGLNSINNYVSDEMYRLAEQVAKGKKVMILANAAPEGSGNFIARDNVRENFLKLGATRADIIDITDDNIDEILNYDVIYGLGGDPGNLIELNQNPKLRQNLLVFLENGGIYLGESAGTMILADDLKCFYDTQRGLKPKWDRTFPSYVGLGLTKLKVYPHWNLKAGKLSDRLAQYEAETGEEFTRMDDGEFILEKFEAA